MNHQAEEALCVRCARAAGCEIPGDWDGPMLACDFYEDIECLLLNKGAVAWLPEPERMEGLCVDCENRGVCILRTREGGTWHCEEYR